MRFCHIRPLFQDLPNWSLFIHQIDPEHSRHSIHHHMCGRNSDSSSRRSSKRREHLHWSYNPDPKKYIYDDPYHNPNETKFNIQ